jgi:hypothetical protein
MFPEDEREFSFLGWAFQSVLAFCTAFAGYFAFGIYVATADTPVWQVLDYLIVLALAIALALVASRVAPTSTIEGRWVWVAPVGLVAPCIVWDLLLGHTSEAAEMFYLGPDGGEGAWGFMFITMPSWGCCCYSAAMWWRRRRQRGASIGLAEGSQLPTERAS